MTSSSKDGTVVAKHKQLTYNAVDLITAITDYLDKILTAIATGRKQAEIYQLLPWNFKNS